MTKIPQVEIETVEMHTGGEPVRIVVSGYPAVKGAKLLQKRRYAREHLDHLRRMLIFEPRGHKDMYGVIPVEPDDERADLAVLFMHNEGYSTMCGHAVIALGRWAVDSGIVAPAGDPTIVRIQCPCGLVTAKVAMDRSADGEARTGDVSFESVPAFAHSLDVGLDVPGYGPLTLDIAYGGAFYAILPAASVGLDVRVSSIAELARAGDAVSKEVTRKLPVEHPDDPDLGFVYGTILTDGGAGLSHDAPSANICIFADGQVDRSPTGSGVTARVALMAARRRIEQGQPVYFESVTRAVFVAREVARGKLGIHTTSSVEVTGRAHYTGTARFTAEPDDMLAGGFLLR